MLYSYNSSVDVSRAMTHDSVRSIVASLNTKVERRSRIVVVAHLDITRLVSSSTYDSVIVSIVQVPCST
eukprot:6171948-Pleurochrysis_carterae.AAC.1